MSEGNPPVSTRRGDDGTTTLLGAGRLPKNDVLHMAPLGDVDEASASLGLARAEADDGEIKELLLELQRLLYRVMGDVAMPKEENVVGPGDVRRVDEVLDAWRARTHLPNEFVVPGESKLGALLDFTRSVVRRAERSMVTAGLAHDHPHALEAVNRLSDVLFVMARNADGRDTLSRG
jgi:cob(I)alamin adenosyltransferase